MVVSSDKVLEELFKFQLTKLKLDVEQTTATVSQTVRTASFGLAALVFPLITVAPENVSVVIKHHPYWVEAAATLGVLAVILDILQNLLATRIAREALERIVVKLKSSDLELTSPADFMFPQNKIALNAKEGFFWLKMVVTGIGLLIMVALIMIDAQINVSPAHSASFVRPCQVPHPSASVALPGQVPHH